MTQLQNILAGCLQDAADRAMLSVTVLPAQETDALLIVNEVQVTTAIACSVQPNQRPLFSPTFFEAIEVATHAKAPLLILCSWRCVVAIDVQAYIHQTGNWLRGIWKGALVAQADRVMIAAHRIAITESLRLALSGVKTGPREWLTNVLAEIESTLVGINHAHVARLIDLVDVPITLPAAPLSLELVTDLLNAYVAEAYRNGLLTYEQLPKLNVVALKDALLSSLLVEVASASHIAGDREHRAECLQIWLAERTGRPIPTIDAIDLALVAGGLHAIGSSHSHRMDSPITVIESGSSHARLANELAQLSKLARTHVVPELSGTPEEMMQALNKLRVGASDVLILFAPVALLRLAAYAQVRHKLLELFDLRWVLTSDAEALCVPAQNICCIVGTSIREVTTYSTTAFVCLRTPIASFLPARTNEEFSEERIEALQVLVRYLRHGNRDRSNGEVSVRHALRSALQRTVLHEGNSWHHYIVPSEVLTGIFSKVLPTMRRLGSFATIAGGIRTGANDVLAPSIKELFNEQIEEQFWQRHVEDNVVADNVVITSETDLESIAGISDSDRRLLLLPNDRKQLEGTNVNNRLLAAEAVGVHQRQTVRHRDPWWHIPLPEVPDLLVCKNQSSRWLVTINSSKAIVTDVAIGVELHDASYLESIALWLNSTLAQFLHLCMHEPDVQAQVTVRDMRECLIPWNDVLERIDAKRMRDVLYRPVTSMLDDFGTTNPDCVSLGTMRKEKRKLDRLILEEIYGLTPVEVLWIVRLVLTWQEQTTNLEHLGSAFAMHLITTRKVKPMSDWYDVRIKQLPLGNVRSITVPHTVTHATVEHGMFSWQVTLWIRQKAETIIECTSESEALLLSLLVDLGCPIAHLPSDEPLVAEVLPLVVSHVQTVEQAIAALVADFPVDLHKHIDRAVKQALM